MTDTKPNFPNDLSEVRIESDNNNFYNDILYNVVIIECASVDGRYWFAFTPMSEVEIRFAEIEDALCELSMQ